MKTRQSRGFTLIEIMVVLVILGLLAVIIVPSVMDRPDEARRIKVQQDIRALESALKLYRLDNYRYPGQSEGLAVLVERPESARNWKGPYVESLPSDPWDQPYRYRNPGKSGRGFDIFSLGADGREGGEGTDADIGNWNLEQ
ncbi:MAG: type II secretion system protein GspG [Porticoccaceae bacterium]|nr:type II secretion system protein GspG [Porticoccaceae bacterium]